ncbi:MAG TPA: Hsp20/alpha crystallin family protein [Methylomirabilota bacterium]|nr:Hsp20/alpha crystallin family protein [Methylomirabilota bacterium]
MSKTSSTTHFVKIDPARGANDTFWTPNTDVYVTDSGLVIKIELAGMRREDLQLVVEGNRVKISGTRPDGCRGPNCKFLVMEINYGAFESSIELPPGYDMKSATASYQNGFLRIDVPRSPAIDGAPVPSSL